MHLSPTSKLGYLSFNYNAYLPFQFGWALSGHCSGHSVFQKCLISSNDIMLQ